MVDGETPSWLDGADSNPATLAAEVDTSIPAPSSTPAPTPAPAASAPAAPTTDNVAGSILTSMNKDVKTTQSKIALPAWAAPGKQGRAWRVKSKQRIPRTVR